MLTNNHYELIHDDFITWMEDNLNAVDTGFFPKFHATFFDPPYYLASIGERFSAENAAPAKEGTDGLFQRQSRGFMGKTWDGFDSPLDFQQWVTKWAKLALHYVYPGAVGLVYGSPRTNHRLKVGLEDAGWIIYDEIYYIHGQGFPKNTNISKLLIRRNELEEAKQFESHGTQLKPAVETITLIRAPRGKLSFLDTATQFGSGLININGTRIPGKAWTWGTQTDIRGGKYDFNRPSDGHVYARNVESNPEGRWPANLVLDEETALELDQNQGIRNGDNRGNTKGKRKSGFFSIGSESGDSEPNAPVYADSGGPSRYFYTAKPATWERESGLEDLVSDTDRKNTHATVKSIQLNTWLATMLLPPELDMPRRILMPFSGSGSEAIGAHLAGWDEIVAIEREDEYIPINKARTSWWMKFNSYDDAKKAAKVITSEAKTKPDKLVPIAITQLPLFASDDA